MINIETLKYLYIIVIALFYINILVIAYFEKVSFKKPTMGLITINTVLLVQRGSIFDCIKNYYEDERYRQIGISSIDILFPIIFISLLGIYCIIRIILDNKKYRKNDMRKFNILVKDYNEFKLKLNALKKNSINSTYEILEDKNSRKNNKNKDLIPNTVVTFFNLPYDEALRYAQELDDRPYKSENDFIRYFSIVLIIAISDFGLVYFRFTQDNYTTILEFVKMTLAK